MRRKLEFDKFTSGLSQRVASWVKDFNDPLDSDTSIQDLTNTVRSELYRVWGYLIEKVNGHEQETKKLKQQLAEKDAKIEELEDRLGNYDSVEDKIAHLNDLSFELEQNYLIEKERNEKLIKCVEFYADEKSYSDEYVQKDGPLYIRATILGDASPLYVAPRGFFNPNYVAGERARKTLEEIKDKK